MGVIRKFFSDEGISWEDIDKEKNKLINDNKKVNYLNNFEANEKIYKVKKNELLIKMGFDLIKNEYSVSYDNNSNTLIIREAIKEKEVK